MTDDHPLHNIFWHCLNEPHRPFSLGNERVRRYQPGFSPIAAFADLNEPDLTGLATLTEPGEVLYAEGWNGPLASTQWAIEFDGSMVAMAWAREDTPPAATVPCQTLGPEHQEAMLALVEQTQPGPFGERNLEMGEFVGHFSPNGQLIAMAGECTRHGPWHEVSGICTHPDHQGRGLGRQLTFEIVRRMHARQETPFLHVRSDNTVARQLYRQLGFQEVLETPVRVIKRLSA
ncbi:MAG TPA: GNAT family N-acetyltransferase [Hydrogenophaga sp.]